MRKVSCHVMRTIMPERIAALVNELPGIQYTSDVATLEETLESNRSRVPVPSLYCC